MKYFIETCVTLYHIDVFEADSIEEAREMRDHTTMEYQEHLDEMFLGRTVGKDDLQRSDYVDDGVMDWDWKGPVMGKEEFKSKYTSL